MPELFFSNNQRFASYRIDQQVYHSPSVFTQVLADLEHFSGPSISSLWLSTVFLRSGKSRTRKTSSPILDLQMIDPIWGTKSDFYQLLQAAHSHHLLVFLDLELSQISQRSALYSRHPDWFTFTQEYHPTGYQNSAIFKFPNAGLKSYLIEILQGWAALGLDGYCLQPNPTIPSSFWKEAEEAISVIKPRFLWLSQDQLIFIKK